MSWTMDWAVLPLRTTKNPKTEQPATVLRTGQGRWLGWERVLRGARAGIPLPGQYGSKEGLTDP